MAEVRKREERKEYKVDKKKTNKPKKDVKKKAAVKKSKPVKTEKKSLWVRFRIFCHGVKSETSKVHWPTKEEMIKYSIATIAFVVFCSLFFELINILFALVQSIFK